MQKNLISKMSIPQQLAKKTFNQNRLTKLRRIDSTNENQVNNLLSFKQNI